MKELLDILCEIGGTQRIGPEIFSAKLDASSADEIVEALRAPYWRALAEFRDRQTRPLIDQTSEMRRECCQDSSSKNRSS